MKSLLVLLTCTACACSCALAQNPWKRHTIDKSSQGADGVKLGDFNGDGLMDVVTGWEEGRVTKLYLNPGPEKIREPWPGGVAGSAPSVEDAVSADFDGDGRMDIASACEGNERLIRIHWGPAPGDLLDPAAWSTVVLPGSVGLTKWMFLVPARFTEGGPLCLVAGAKDPDGVVGWWEIPPNARDVAAWVWHPLCPAGWVMGIEVLDLDGDGFRDILFTDRRPPHRGLWWLQHPGAAGPGGSWKKRSLGLENLADPPDNPGKEGHLAMLMFLSVQDINADAKPDVLVAADRQIALLTRSDDPGVTFHLATIPIPRKYSGAKAVMAADMDGDGRLELVFTTVDATPGQDLGVGLVRSAKGIHEGPWTIEDIGGTEGKKFDRIELLDLTGNGLPDILTCEEVTNIGVFWYENTAKPRP